MASILSEKITDIISQETLDKLAADYKVSFLTKGKRPHISRLIKKYDIVRSDYDMVVGLCGGTEYLHTYLSKDIELQKDNVLDLLDHTITELKKRIPKMSNAELISTTKVLGKISGREAPENQVNTQINFDMDKYLADRA